MLSDLRNPLLAMCLMLGPGTLPAALAQHAPATSAPTTQSLSGTSVQEHITVDASGVTTQTADINEKLFDDAPPSEGGWKGLARLLEALAPDVDTTIPLTPSQITDRISTMLDQGQYQQAFDIIEKRRAQLEATQTVGTDVQLLFLRSRALSGLNRHEEAIESYLNMTTMYPELPEPWNNLASEYARLGRLDMARDALEMALIANPHYAAAHVNMGQIQLLLAERSFEQAATLGQPSAAQEAQNIRSLVQD